MWAYDAEPKQALKRGVAEALGRAASAGVPIHMVARIQTQYAVSRSCVVCHPQFTVRQGSSRSLEDTRGCMPRLTRAFGCYHSMTGPLHS